MPHLIPCGWREGPPKKYVPVLQSLEDHQKQPRQFPLGYLAEDEQTRGAAEAAGGKG